MMTKVETFKNGWHLVMDQGVPCGMYTVIVRNAAGGVHDKIRTDTYRDAREYYRAFSAIARNA